MTGSVFVNSGLRSVSPALGDEVSEQTHQFDAASFHHSQRQGLL